MAKQDAIGAQFETTSNARQNYLTRKRKAGRRRIVMFVWGTLALLVGMVACSSLPGAVGEETADGAIKNNWLFFGWVSAWVILIGVLMAAPYRWIFRDIRPRRTLLWLRRFHLTDPKLFPIHEALKKSRHYVTTPLTIRDPRMATDRSSGSPMALGLRFLRWAIALFALVLLAIVIYVVFAEGFEIEDGQAASIGLSMFVGAVIIILLGLPTWGLWKLLKAIEGRLGFDSLPRKPAAAIKDLDGFFRRVTRGLHAPSAVRIFRAHDDNWQAVVKHAVERSDLVLLDVSQLTDNVEWEITTVFAAKAPEAVILAVQAEAETGEACHKILSRLEVLAGAEAMSRIELLVYPAWQKTDGKTSLKDIADALRERMLNAIDHLGHRQNAPAG